MQDDVEWSDDSEGSERIESRHSKYKKFEVATRSLFRRSELERTIEKWEKRGWEVHEQRAISKNKVELTMAYHLTKAQIENADRKAGWGCAALIIVAVVIGVGSMISGGSSSSSRSPSTRVPANVVVQVTRTATNTQRPSRTPREVVTNTRTPKPTSTVTLQPSDTSTPTVRPSNTPKPTNTLTPVTQGRVNSDQGVRMREEPSNSANIVAMVTADQIFTIVSIEDDWIQVELGDGQRGWIADFLVQGMDRNNSTERVTNTQLPTQTPRATQVVEEKPCVFEDLLRVPGFLVIRTDRDGQTRVIYEVEDDYELTVFWSDSEYDIMPPVEATTVISGITVEYAHDELQDFYFQFRYGGYYYSGDIYEVPFDIAETYMIRYVYAFDRCGGR